MPQPNMNQMLKQVQKMQADMLAAQEKLKELGYTKVTRVQLQAGHSPLQAEVWKFVDEVLGAK